MPTCTKCGEEGAPPKRGAGVGSGLCRGCFHKEGKRAWDLKNKEHVSAYGRARYVRDAEQIKFRARTYYAENIAARKEYNRVYNIATAEVRHQKAKAKRVADVDLSRANDRARYAKNAESRRECARRLRSNAPYRFRISDAKQDLRKAGLTVVPTTLAELLEAHRAVKRLIKELT
jgi:hypothetical protein